MPTTARARRIPPSWRHWLAAAAPYVLPVNLLLIVAASTAPATAPFWWDLAMLIVHGAEPRVFVKISANGPLWNLLSGVPLALLAVTIWAAWTHGNTLCETCAAKFPLDPQEQARRRDRRLRFVHVLDDKLQAASPRRVLLGLAGFLVVPLILPGGWPELLWYTPAYVGFACVLASSATHAALEPWCPYCNHGGDDDSEEAPVPTGGRGAPVPA